MGSCLLQHQIKDVEEAYGIFCRWVTQRTWGIHITSNAGMERAFCRLSKGALIHYRVSVNTLQGRIWSHIVEHQHLWAERPIHTCPTDQMFLYIYIVHFDLAYWHLYCYMDFISLWYILFFVVVIYKPCCWCSLRLCWACNQHRCWPIHWHLFTLWLSVHLLIERISFEKSHWIFVHSPWCMIGWSTSTWLPSKRRIEMRWEVELKLE